MKRCSKCREWFPADTYTIARYRTDGTPIRRARCTRCRTAQRRAWRDAHLERDRANVNRWQRAEYAKNGEWAGERRARDRERHSGSAAYQRGGTTARVPAAPVAEAVTRSGLSLTEIANRTGRDRESVKRALQAEHMTPAGAVGILEAIDLAPAEVGL